ncbi:hypothetical protein SAMN04515618_102311 [Collimonas sp. OK307]|uniref:hypothetical protein n=1 Tax=Collimonas sp. OK307 TaxID=1801620 RepID=UPI0008E72C77|nr:hypothetical protein [Collimonas sp. OK307]SFH74729.1 hypothetical protein SAMN04515618_102311 [Collimonas sp. OK307]
MKKLLALSAFAVLALQGCAVYGLDYPGVIVAPEGRAQGGPGNGFCPPGQAKKGNC